MAASAIPTSPPAEPIDVIGGLRQRRKSAHSLPPLAMPSVDTNRSVGRTNVNDQNNVEEEGRELFALFVREQILQEGNQNHLPADIDVDQYMMDTPISISTTPEVSNHIWTNTGRELREMADEFARTKERERVRQRAYEVGNDITFAQFEALLNELFTDNSITNERIMVLFFFCSDLSIRMLKEKAIEYFKRFIEWSVRYITGTVCTWVREHGGWAEVLSHGMALVSKVILGMAAFGIVSAVVFQLMSRKL